ncbi:MAG: NnrS family protein [Proteobacteria bacterium]|nr:NnrS family protein [Pseudomonadota bacterium]
MPESDHPPASAEGFALFAYGFRPFFLVAGAYATLAMLVWIPVSLGDVALALPVPAPVWHGHEMVFGYALAVVTGFFLTAVPNWTSRPAVRGPLLVALTAAWLAGRLAYGAAGILPPLLVAVLDLAHIPFLIAVVSPALFGAASRRNFVFIPILAVLFAGNLLGHLAALGVGWADAGQGIRLAVRTLVLLIVIVGGRIVPSFTSSTLRREGGDPGLVLRPGLERASMALMVLWIVAELVAEDSPAAGALALGAALVLALRLAGWQTRRTLGSPILWVLHLGYAWTIIGLALAGLAGLGAGVPPASALHALTVGAIGTMTLAVMSRAALGHTGREIVAPPAIVAAYVLVSLAAIGRIALPVAWPGPGAYALAGALWALAFALFTWVYFPVLTRRRIDGRPG